jgi:N-acetyl-anhydromuramyl-L-alanine amidase AmpD
MTPRWIGCAPQNFHSGRPPDLTPSAIVLHRSGGSLSDLRARFAEPTSSLSAHYAVGRDGSIDQYVTEADTAFHAGMVVNSRWPGLKERINPNLYTFAIEHEGSAASGWSDAQRVASAALIAEIANRWSIPISAEAVVPHSAIRASADCPGADYPLDEILEMARARPAVSTDEMELVMAPDAPRPDGSLSIDRTTLALPPSQYYPETVSKDLIVLHFTAGTSARSAVNTWRATPEHVATAYVVDADGTIYEVFPPSSWAYHLGLKGGTPHERRSIGIEIANVGPLQPAPNDPAVLSWWPNSWKQPYCRIDDSARYVRRDYRGKRYFAAFPDPQMDAVGRLVRSLCDSFGIERRLPAAGQRLECDLAAYGGYKGIATHANFRPDKWDVGPAFEWDRLGF